MTAYGYRLFTMASYFGRSRDTVPLDDFSSLGKPGLGIEELERHLLELQDELLFGAPNYWSEPTDQDEDEDEDPTISVSVKKHPYLRVRRVVRQANRLAVSVEYGREGDYEILLSQDGSDPIPLKGKATARRFRVWFYFPVSGANAFMVSETKGRTHAGRPLVHWLRVKNQRAAVTFDTDGARTELPWARWDLTETLDENRIDEVLQESSEHSITLRRRSIDTANNRHRGELKLTQQGVPLSKTDDLKAIIKGWWTNRSKGKEPEVRKEAAAHLGTLIGVSDASTSLDFNDGEITFLEKNKVQTISPSSIERLFVYPLGEKVPSDADLLVAAVNVLRPVAEDLKIDIRLSTV